MDGNVHAMSMSYFRKSCMVDRVGDTVSEVLSVEKIVQILAVASYIFK